ncbi:Polysaccharide biosynthesis protein [Clostridiales bacterium CHKCI001]|nr:Polysaccharide biosynthesis protein [Clostridiales bacterium CHKCI001]
MKRKWNTILKRYHQMPVAAKAGIWFIICSVIQKSFSLITTPIFTRLLTKEQYGEYNIYLTWLQVITIICTFRLDFGVFNKGMSKYKEDKDGYTITMQTTTTIITLIGLIVYLIFQNFINQLTGLSTLVTIFIFMEILFLSAMNFWMLRQRYDFKYRGVVLAVVGMSFANLVIGLVAVLLMEEKGFARILSCIMVQVCFGFVFYIINMKKSKKIYIVEYIRFAFLFNLPLIPHYFSSYILEQSDRIMIQKMCGVQQVALYSVSYNIGMLAKIVVNSVNNALIPWQYRKLEEKQYKVIDTNLIMLTTGMLIILILCIAFAPELVYVMAGKEYMEAIYVVPPVTLSMFFVFIYGVFCNIEFFYDANKFTMVNSLVAAGINLGLNFIFIPIFGYVAAGYTTLVCYIFLTVTHFFYVNYVYRNTTEEKQIFSMASLARLSVLIIVITGIFLVLYKNAVIRYLFIIVGLIGVVAKRKQIMNIIKLLIKKEGIQ